MTLADLGGLVARHDHRIRLRREVSARSREPPGACRRSPMTSRRRQFRGLVAALRAEVLEAQKSRRRRSIWLDVVVEGGRVSEDSGLEARRYPLSRHASANRAGPAGDRSR